MVICRLVTIVLVLLQSGLTAAHAHTHTDPAGHTESPHIHICQFLELFGPVHDEEGHDGSDHDHDAVYLSDMMTSAAPPTVELAALDLAVVEAQPAFEPIPNRLPFPLGLSPSTAGPHPPLYITLCSLTI